MRLNSIDGSILDIVTELNGTGIRSALHLNNIGKPVVSDVNIPSTHNHKRAHCTAVINSKLGNFTLHQQVPVLSVLDYMASQHLRG